MQASLRHYFFLNFVCINALLDLLKYPECNQISISGNGKPVREIDVQTEKNHGITHSTTYVKSHEGGGKMRRHGRY